MGLLLSNIENGVFDSITILNGHTGIWCPESCNNVVIKNSQISGIDGSGISFQGNDIVIQNNTITSLNDGIIAEGEGVDIVENRINSGGFGIFLQPGNHYSVVDNFIQSDNEVGITGSFVVDSNRIYLYNTLLQKLLIKCSSTLNQLKSHQTLNLDKGVERIFGLAI